MTAFPFGPLSIDPVEFASHGNAVLGIRGSGKTYTATALAEHLFDAGIPFFAFDPIGVWRWLRVPGAGKGYPVVVAGGQAADLPLTVEGAADLTRAAMQGGVSLVFDLFDMHLSKGDWRKIVTAAVRTMLHENHGHGLRHVFLEEAAEFIPQKPHDFIVYAELEKLARMGGNVRLGYTLINQRSQEVSKAILELCENVFLHRQRGKNALENMDKWLAAAEAPDRKKIRTSLPELPQGQCWAWLGGDKPMPPTLIKVPTKNSLHPDRRVMRGDAAPQKVAPVDVAEFIARMKGKAVVAVQTAAGAPTKPIKTKETDVTKEEAEALKTENARLTLQVDTLTKELGTLRDRLGFAGEPVRHDAPPGPGPVAGRVGNGGAPPELGDIEAIYQAVKLRLTNEAPGLLRVLTIKPELEVKVERRVIQMDDSNFRGRIARLLASGFYNEGATNSATRKELARTGKDMDNKSIWRFLEELKSTGFLTKEGEAYRAVEGMKVNIVEG